MKQDYIEIGSTPAEESCVQMGNSIPWDGYRARTEMSAFIHQLRRKFGPEPKGARLHVKMFNAGEYSEVVCSYVDEVSYDYALKCANYAPVNWDLFSLVELSNCGIDVNQIRSQYN